MEGTAAIILGISAPVFVIFLFLFYGTKANAKKLDTLIKIVEHGGNVDPEMMDLLNPPRGPAMDLRKGLTWLAIGIPLTLGLAMIDGGREWQTGIFGLIPVFIGIAHLIVMKYGPSEAKPG